MEITTQLPLSEWYFNSTLAKVLYKISDWVECAVFSALVLLQPSLLLIDHGHYG